MMKKLFLMFVLNIVSTPVFAMYWGCNDLTTTEMEKAKSVLQAAQEIVLLDYHNTPHIIKYEDIDETLYDADNFGHVRLFEINTHEAIVGANELFVRDKEGKKYQNLGLIIGCQPPSINYVKEINPDLSFITLKDQYFKIKEKYEKCSTDIEYEKAKDYDENHIRSFDIRIEHSAITDCYIDVAYELFDVFHPNNPQEYKDNLLNFIKYYNNVMFDAYKGMDGYLGGSIISDYVSVHVLFMTKKIVGEYIKQTGSAGDFIEEIKHDETTEVTEFDN